MLEIFLSLVVFYTIWKWQNRSRKPKVKYESIEEYEKAEKKMMDYYTRDFYKKANEIDKEIKEEHYTDDERNINNEKNITINIYQQNNYIIKDGINNMD